jgi:hypothetical protein
MIAGPVTAGCTRCNWEGLSTRQQRGSFACFLLSIKDIWHRVAFCQQLLVRDHPSQAQAQAIHELQLLHSILLILHTIVHDHPQSPHSTVPAPEPVWPLQQHPSKGANPAAAQALSFHRTSVWGLPGSAPAHDSNAIFKVCSVAARRGSARRRSWDSSKQHACRHAKQEKPQAAAEDAPLPSRSSRARQQTRTRSTPARRPRASSLPFRPGAAREPWLVAAENPAPPPPGPALVRLAPRGTGSRAGRARAHRVRATGRGAVDGVGGGRAWAWRRAGLGRGGAGRRVRLGCVRGAAGRLGGGPPAHDAVGGGGGLG